MKTLIYFNRPDCPTDLGISQLTDNVTLFLEERKDKIVNPIIDKNILTFDVNYTNENDEQLVRRGFALLVETPENFEN